MKVYNVFLRDNEVDGFVLEDSLFSLHEALADYVGEGTSHRVFDYDSEFVNYESYRHIFFESGIEVLIVGKEIR